MARIGGLQILVLTGLCALMLSACTDSHFHPTLGATPAAVTCGSGTGSLVINNNSGENVTVALQSGSTALPSLTIANGASVSTAEPVGTVQVTASGVLTGNNLLLAAPSIVCGNASSLTISPEPTYALNVSAVGQGWVAMSATNTGAIQCLSGSTSACSQTFLKNQTVTLTATAQSGSQFSGWSGACTGPSDVCTVAMSQIQDVTAQFSAINSPLNVILSGNGQGAVVSNPSDIACGNISGTSNTVCSSGPDDGTVITLTATAGPGSQFAGWDGSCLGQMGNTCQVTIAQSTVVGAQFTLIPQQLTIALSGTGTGVVEGGNPAPGNPYPAYCASPGDTAPTYQAQNCSPDFNYGTLVTLSAQPDTGMVFTAWSGACSGSSATCTVPMDQAQNVTAQFDLAPEGVQVSISGSGQGDVSSQPSGISCASPSAGSSASGCSANFSYGTSVTLSATASSGSYFNGWTSGPCMGSSAASCTFSAQPGLMIAADFETLNPLMLNVSGPGVVIVEGTATSCTGSCSVPVQAGQQVTLQAEPPTSSIWAALNSTFIGWGGLCSGTSGTSCTLSFDQISAAGATVSAEFGYRVSLSSSGTGLGVVASNVSGFYCAGPSNPACAVTAATVGQTITLTAGAETGSVFMGWVTGPCAGSSSPTCNFTVSGIIGNIQADFEIPESLSVSVSGPNALQISYADPLGNAISVTCSSAGEAACNQSIPENTLVTLAIPSGGSSKVTAVTWGGACAGTTGTSCQVTMSSAQSVTLTTPYIDSMTLNVSGTGSVIVDYTDSSGASQSITCSAVCGFEARGGSQVNVSAVLGSNVQSWQGVACSGQTCTFAAPSDGSSMNFGVDFPP